MRAYLQLVRLPAVFTAMADILLGFLLTHLSIDAAPLKLGMLLVASAGLYLSGMVFNDVFDRRIDAEERPQRPIPSGRVPVMSAIRLGILLMAAGVGAANVVGVPSLIIACGIVVSIFAYDGLLKGTLLGPVAMGTCRFLNVMLGASASDYAIMVWGRPQTLVALAIGVYIAGVTWFARQEARTGNRWQLTGAALLINAALGGLAWLMMKWPWPGEISLVRPLLILAVIAFTIDRRLIAAVLQPTPGRVQLAVKMLLLSLVMVDAMMVYTKTGDAAAALITALLLAPALVLGRFLYVT